MLFTEKLSARTRSADSMLCVGLDPDPAKFPQCILAEPDPIYAFCEQIVRATAPYVCAYKPQIAYFAANRAEDALERISSLIKSEHPDIPVILDAKRGDIGSTARQYAKEAFVRYNADAVTLSPYMGFDTIEPYFEYPDRGIIVLCRTSNPGGKDIEELVAGGEPFGAPLAAELVLHEAVGEVGDVGEAPRLGEAGLGRGPVGVVVAVSPGRVARDGAAADDVEGERLRAEGGCGGDD